MYKIDCLPNHYPFFCQRMAAKCLLRLPGPFILCRCAAGQRGPEPRRIRSWEKPLLALKEPLYMHGTSFLIATPPTQSKTAVVWIHHFLCLLLHCYELSYACSVLCSDKLNSDTSTLCERPFLPPSYSPWRGTGVI